MAKDMNVPKADILQTLSLDNWSIIYIEDYVGDEPFLFFRDDPLHHSHVTLWSGAARNDEEQGIAQWVNTNATGIPTGLSACFAWFVTHDRHL